jgi:Bacterial Ig-like domain (group 3)
MRLRTLLATTVTGTLALGVGAGVLGAPALATTIPDPAAGGALSTWGNTADESASPAITIPEGLTGPMLSVAASNRATGVVTADGHVRVWGAPNAAEAEEIPSGITDAAAISLSINYGAVLHNDGHITAWGAPDGVDPALLSNVPTDLRAKAIAIQGGRGTGYAVRTNGTLAVWGAVPLVTPPTEDMDDLVDVSASLFHVLALHADGTVTTWGTPLPGLLPAPDFGDKKVAKITTGGPLSGVIFEDGTIDIWGYPVPTDEPAFDGLTPATKVTSLGLWSTVSTSNAVAVTADGTVHAWGSDAPVTTVPEDLGQPVSAVAVGAAHVATITTTFRDLTKPTITGTPKVGQTLTATPATFSMAPDAPATGQWYAGNDPIAGKTATTLALDTTQVGKQISYRTTATRGEDTITSASAPTTAVAALAPPTVASTTTLAVAPTTGTIGTTRTITATVTKTGGTPTGTVTFTTGTTTGTATLAAGKATWTLPTTLPVGTHQITATYTGDTTTNPSTATALTVTVTKANATITAKAKSKGKTKKITKKTTLTITVKAPTGINPTGKVTITLKGKTKKTITTTVNAQGKATATFKKLKHGKYKATLKYTGNTNLNPTTGKATFKA